jgi:hypothetical protein
MTAAPFYTRHRGPFQLSVTRPAEKPGFRTSEWLPGRLDGEDCLAEARALLTDPRDTIIAVSVWDVCENQFVMSYRKEDLQAGRMEIQDRQPTDADRSPCDEPAQDQRPQVEDRGANIGSPKPARRTTGRRDPTVYRWVDGAEPIPQLGANAMKLVGAFQARREATLTEIAADLAGQLDVERPERFISAYASRFKTLGLLEVA